MMPSIPVTLGDGSIAIAPTAKVEVAVSFLPSFTRCTLIMSLSCLRHLNFLPSGRYHNLLELSKVVFRHFSRIKLSEACAGARPGPGGRMRPKECAFEDEYLRACYQLLGFSASICSQWPCGGGSIDLFLPTQKWGIEFIRESHDLQEHLARFDSDPRGRYYSAIEAHAMVDWLVVDCCHATPLTPCEYHPPAPLYPIRPVLTGLADPGEERLIRLVFLDNYSIVKLLDNHNNLIEEFPI